MRALARWLSNVIHRRILGVALPPQDFLPVTRIIDDDEPASRGLIEAGYQAAEAAFLKHFPA